jgi:hypothetical protein
MPERPRHPHSRIFTTTKSEALPASLLLTPDHVRGGASAPICYAPSANPRNTIADATPAKSHKVSATRPSGKMTLNPNASIAAAPIPLKITASLIGTSRFSYLLPGERGSPSRSLNKANARAFPAFKDFFQT